ncbi:MAG: substrate-binding domain-containing protein [Methylobacteriaceae bacterium]|jgi:phosphate transport system substrate-binding protein|nr:substrate-binding domain-containing protein [Methylobacteriaceae bacterium]
MRVHKEIAFVCLAALFLLLAYPFQYAVGELARDLGRPGYILHFLSFVFAATGLVAVRFRHGHPEARLAAKCIGFVMGAVALLLASQLLVYPGNVRMIFAGLALSFAGIPILGRLLFRSGATLKDTACLVGFAVLFGLLTAAAVHRFVPDDPFPGSRLSADEEADIAARLDHHRTHTRGGQVAELDDPPTLTFPSGADLPRLDGALSLNTLYAAFAHAVYPPDGYVIDYHNTIAAYKRLVDREVDIIFVPLPSEAQLNYAAKNRARMAFTLIAKEAVVFFVNPRNRVQSLSQQQIRDIYSGKISNWLSLGGGFHPIRAYYRDEGSSGQAWFHRFMGKLPLIESARVRPNTRPGGIISDVAETSSDETAERDVFSSAIGFSFRYFCRLAVEKGAVRLLAVDGVSPTWDNIASGAYPLSIDYYAVTLEDNDNPNIPKLLEWILSPQGQSLVVKTGYVSVR